MSLSEKIQKLDALKEELQSQLPLSFEIQKKVDDKYRLEWNFHSNHIEGNTLTYGQTQMLLFFGKSTGDHEKRNFDEMEAHDVAVQMIKDWSIDKEREITESDIRQLNEVILVRPFWKEAVTADGQPTRKQIIPGKYKSSPNSVQLKNGQIHHYASPEETPVLMKELSETYVKSRERHPLVVAALIHHRFTEIHPFDDGNGRVSRLWANYILLKDGYTPLIIRTDRKEEYLTALQKADTGDLDAFVEFLAEELMWSIEISLKAAKGESIEEEDDLDKKIALLDAKINRIDTKEAQISREDYLISSLVHNHVIELIQKIDKKTRTIQGWFNKSSYTINIFDSKSTFGFEDDIETSDFVYQTNFQELDDLGIVVLFEGFKKGGKDAFDVYCGVLFEFEKWKWIVSINGSTNIVSENFYGDMELTPSMDGIAKLFTDRLVELIENQLNSPK